MKKRVLSLLLAVSIIFSLLPVTFAAEVPKTDASNLPQSDGNTMRLWYDEPVGSADWTNRCLPIGNGTIGGLTYGEVVKERLHVNEKTLWGGSPITDPHSLDNYIFDGVALNAQRKAMDNHETQVFPAGQATPVGMGNKSDALMGQYRDLGDIYFDFTAAGLTKNVTNYVRDLDLRTAVSSVNFDYDGIHYEREYLASHPDNVMVSHFTASEGGKLSFTASLSTGSSGLGATATAEGSFMKMSGTLSASGEKWIFMAGVYADGGTVTANADGTITVAGADEATVYVYSDTDYLPEYPEYTDGRSMETILADGKKVIEAAGAKGYEEVREDHVADHSELFSRVEIDLGGTCPDLPTDELMAAYRGGDHQLAVEEMAFQMGRYLMIAGSREGDDLPTNLCGIWLVGDAGSYWGSDFHFNVNVQMNYWPAMTTNLAECETVFNDFVESLVVPGRLTAAVSNGVKTEDYMNTPLGEGNGFMINTQVNSWGHTWPIGSQEYGWNIGGSSWAMQNLYDYYLFTGDEEFLENHLYPMLKEMAKFWDQYLWWSDYQQRWVVGPSVSAEQGPTVNGTTYDQSLVWELYKMAINASETLGVDEYLRESWEAKQAGLNPILIGDEGQVKEWYEETTFGKGQAGNLPETSVPNWEAGFSGRHRHSSHLVGLFPGTLINKDNEEYLDAALIALEQRGFEATGWSKAMKINMWARTGDAENTHKMVAAMCAGNTSGLLDNLLDSHPPFQIDGNFGLTAGMAEMLLQSQLGYTQFLPCLPSAWPDGSVKGLVARGNFEIGMDWSNSRADQFTITSRNGGTFTGEYENLSGYTVKDSDGNPVETTALGKDKLSFETTKGETYTIDLSGASEMDVQIKVGQNLVSSMTDSRLATAKSILESAIEAAQNGTSTAEELAAANTTASQAMAFLSDIKEAEAFYAEKEEAAGTRSQIQTALNALASEIEDAGALLKNSGATADEFAAEAADLTAARKEVTNIMGVLSSFDKKLEEAEAFYAEKAELGTVWVAADALLKSLSDTIAKANSLLENASTTSDELTASTKAMGDGISALKQLIDSINLTADTTGGTLTMTASDSQFEVRYTLDGNAPSLISKLYEEPSSLPQKTVTIRAALFIGDVQMSKVFEFPWNGGNLAASASEVVASSGSDYAKATDGNKGTYWSSGYGASKPVTLTLTFEEPVTFDQAYVLGVNYYDYYYAKSIAVDYWDAANEDWVEIAAEPELYPDMEASFTFDEVTSTQIRLRVEDYQRYSQIAEFQISYSKTGGAVDLTELQDLVAQAEDLKAGDAYAAADEAVRKEFDTYLTIAKAISENTASDADTVEAAIDALLDVMAELDGVTPEKALEVLNEQLGLAEALSATLTEADQASTREILDNFIEKAQEVRDQAIEKKYYTSAKSLKRAIARTEEAVKLVKKLGEAKPFRDDYVKKAGQWNAATEPITALSDEINTADGLILNPVAAADAIKLQVRKLDAAMEAVTQLFDSVSVEITIADGKATMTASDEQFEIRYTLDGNTPSLISKTYGEPVELPNRALTIKAAAFVGDVRISDVVTETITGVNLALGSTATSDTEDWGSGYDPASAVDGSLTTRWAPKSSTPSLTVDLGQSYKICQVAVRQISYARINSFEIWTSADGEEGSWVKAYTESAAAANAAYDFDAVNARFVKLVITAGIGEANIEEFEIYAAPETEDPADMTALNAAIASAETAKSDGTYAAAHDEMKAEFDYYLEIAQEVAGNENSDADTVEAAEKALTDAIAGLSKKLVTVNSGTGGGFYTEGETVTIQADEAPAGKRFSKWTVDSGDIELASSSSSETTFTMPAEDVEVTASYKRKSSGGGTTPSQPTEPEMPEEPKFPFTDVPTTAWYYESVKGAWEKNLIDGVTATLYKPDSTLTVAQAIKLAAALHQMNADGKVTLTNAEDTWYASYVDYAIEKGVIEAAYKNYTAAQMNAAATRAEFVHIFYGAMPESSYTAKNTVGDNKIPDVKLTDKYGSEIYTFYRAGILTGSDTAGTFHAANSIKRSEAAAILIRMYEASARQGITL